MKKLILSLIMMMPLMASAQRVDKPGEPYYVYCVFCYSSITASIYISDLYLETLYDESNEKLKFHSEADALTYMSKRGWEYVEKINPTEYLMRKKVMSDEQAKEGLTFKDSKKKK